MTEQTQMTAPDVRAPRLVVVPNDPIEHYEQAGYDYLESYFNPTGMFHEVVVLSPLEKRERDAFGMHIRGVPASEFRRVLAEIRPSVVRAYAPHWPSDLACGNRLPDVPVIVSVHNDRLDRMSPSLRYADRVICISEAVREQVMKVGVDPRRVRMLPNRVDLDRFHPVTEPDALSAIARRFPPGKHILHVGRRVHQKNLDTLIQALPLLPAEYSCVFVGMGDKAPYVALAGEWGVERRCFWIDAVKNAELPAWYSWCDCFCVPSRYEGFGIVFIEAAACGAPIVTSDIRPMNEYLTHGVSAHLVKEFTDPRLLAEAILRVCQDPDHRRTISAGARHMARSFEKRVVDEAEAAIYWEAIGLPPLTLQRRVTLSAWRSRRALQSQLGRYRRFLARSLQAAKRLSQINL